MKINRYLGIFVAMAFTSCSYPQSTLNKDGTFTLTRPIQSVAMTEPGISGAHNYLTLDAHEKCPRGWQVLAENIQTIDSQESMIWQIKCH